MEQPQDQMMIARSVMKRRTVALRHLADAHPSKIVLAEAILPEDVAILGALAKS